MKLTNAIKKLTLYGFEVKTTEINLEAKKGNNIVGCEITTNGSTENFYVENTAQNSEKKSFDNLVSAIRQTIWFK